MLETSQETAALQRLLDESYSAASPHLRGIINADRRLTALDIVALLTGMRVLAVATVTAAGEPRISALDGHFLHATWTFSTSGAAVKARHLAVRPAVSAAHIDNEELAVFAHGTADRLQPGGDGWQETIDHWTAHYDSSPLDWGDDIAMYRLIPNWMVGYAWKRTELLARRGISGGPTAG